EGAGERALGVLLAQHGVLFRRQQLPPFLRRVDHLEGLRGGVSAAAPPSEDADAGSSDGNQGDGTQANLASRNHDLSFGPVRSARIVLTGNLGALSRAAIQLAR